MRPKRGPYRGTDERQRAILDAALACFSEQGFVATTMADIRRRSGASHGSIYHHFNSKEELAAAVYLQGIRDYQAGLVGELSTASGAREGIRAIIAYHLSWARDHPDHARFLARMRHAHFMRAAEAELDEENASFIDTLGGFFARHVKRGTLRRLSGELYVAFLLGPAQELARHWLLAGKALDLERAIEELSDAAWRALRRGTRDRDDGGTS